MDEVLKSFRVLDLEVGAPSKAVKKAYRDLVKKWHPDQFTNDPKQRQEAEEKLKEINLAYERIQDYQASDSIPSTIKPSQPRKTQTARPAAKAPGVSPQPRPQAYSSPPPPSASPDTGPKKPETAATNAASRKRAPSLWQRRFVRPAAIVAGAMAVFFLLLNSHFPPQEKEKREEKEETVTPLLLPVVRPPTPNLDSPKPTSQDAVQPMQELLTPRSESPGAPRPKAAELPRSIGNLSVATTRPEEIALSKVASALKAKLPERGQSLVQSIPVPDKEDANAHFQRGLRYAQGEGVPQDYAEAVKWYRLAAEAGHASAQKNLGFLYASGKGLPQDNSEAEKWFRKAAAQGHTGAEFAQALMSLTKTNAQRSLSLGLKNANSPAALQGENAEAQFQRALRSAKGDGTTQDYAEAVKWYRLAADAGHAGAQRNLGFLYSSGKGVPRDEAEAEKWFCKAATQGSLGASLANAVVSLSKSGKAVDSAPTGKQSTPTASTNQLGP